MSNISSDQQTTTLQPMAFPLTGARLIEASAGTGKTFTIASLYLRLLLGHGGEQYGYGQPLSVEQILVVTFTEAATAELKGRIRRRIHEARLAFARGLSHDPVIKPLLEVIEDHAQAADLLLAAERQMDEAAIFTIHGFCQRMLVENAFESGSRFENEFVTDETRLKNQVVADYWRRYFYSLPAASIQLIRSYWAKPAQLYQQIHHHLSGKAETLSVALPDGELVQLLQSVLDNVDQLKLMWREQSPAALDLLDQAIEQKVIDKRSYSAANLPKWKEKVNAWAQQPTLDDSLPDELNRFSLAMLAEKTKSGITPQHPLFSAIEDFLCHTTTLKPLLMAHAIHQCRILLAERKNEHQWLSFDDLLSQLAYALDDDPSGALAGRIRQLYPVAMIDEFQDTDPLQYAIFSGIYLAEPRCGLFMIGDPKQAIYAFRGADIFTYIKARNQVVDHYTLGINWRSSQQVIESVNQLFSGCDAPFIYQQDIPFTAAGYSDKADERQWLLADEVQPAVTLWYPDGNSLINRETYNQQMANATAAQIQAILMHSDAGSGGLKTSESVKAIAANNIAVLVRTGREGKLVKRALASQGIASVYLSNQDSVFSSPVARDLLRLLQAVHLPDNERLVRSALATPLFALPITQLDELNYDESAWDRVNLEFRSYRQLWQQRGILPMLRAVLIQRQFAQRWLSEMDGERHLTDYLHLAELLQSASLEIESDVALIRFLSQSIDDAQEGIGGDDQQIMRLESEANLVQIVTIHKSKGLEYDIVFAPFVMNYRAVSGRDGEAKYHDSHSDETIIDISPDSDALEKADRERLAEDLRLLYVALTRAVYGLYIGIAPLAKPGARSFSGESVAHLSAMGYLLQNGQAGDADRLAEALRTYVAQTSSSVIAIPPELPAHGYTAPQAGTAALDYSQLQRPIERSWRMTSYSNLVKQSAHSHALAAELEVPGFDLDSAEETNQPAVIQDEKNIFTFARGARPGTFLHALLEKVEFTQAAGSEVNLAIIEKLMEQEQIDELWQPVLTAMIDRVMTTALDSKSLKLGTIPPEQRLVEMEFLLPIALLNAPRLNQIIRRFDPLSARAEELGFFPVQGMLKGFIDLVFEYQGRYYILDWKSNHLGNHPDDYTQSRIEQAMVEHRYDLQYHLYALALHRFLAMRIPDYDYARHFGGVYYLFLRGVNPGTTNGIYYTRPDEELIEQLNAWMDGRDLPINPAGQMELEL